MYKDKIRRIKLYIIFASHVTRNRIDPNIANIAKKKREREKKRYCGIGPVGVSVKSVKEASSRSTYCAKASGPFISAERSCKNGGEEN